MRYYIVFIVVIIFFTFCKQQHSKKISGKDLIRQNCISCHNYNATRSVYRPSIFEMSEMGADFRKIYDKAIADTSHSIYFKELNNEQRDMLYKAILNEQRIIIDSMR